MGTKLNNFEQGELVAMMILLNIISISSAKKDKLVWNGNRSRHFFVHSLYSNFMVAVAVCDTLVMPKIWLNVSPTKTELFSWFAMMEKLPTRAYLFRIGLCSIATNVCAFCGHFGEKTDHVLVT